MVDARNLPAVIESVGDDAFRRRTVETGFWTKLKRNLARVPFAEDLVAAFYCASDPATPARVRTILFGALAYFVLPSDMIPDVFVGMGFLDDGAVISAAIASVSAHLKPVHRDRARLWLAGEDGSADVA
ncbi:MAG: hypothetical protein CMM50_18380 [Rhodospirillaceae bacterium]|nr:hypothetical protein [Rhodospirillaceae bacterium]